MIDEAVVCALVDIHFKKCPDINSAPEFRAKVAWAMLGDCKERREADRRIKEMDGMK